MLDNFHFLRPIWLVSLPLLAVVCFFLWRLKGESREWQGFIDKSMLPYLTFGNKVSSVKWPVLNLALAWFIATIALAGPTWQKLPQPQFINQYPIVVIADLSPSMLVEDIKPTRLARMRFKLIDLLNARKAGLTALVVYAGDSHILAPLSDDTETLISLVPTLSPEVMPISGSNVEEAIEQATGLIDDQGFQSAGIILLTDGVTEQAARNIDVALDEKNINFSIIGIGTEEGAPIPISDQAFAKDQSGNIILAKLNSHRLITLAEKNGGTYSDLTLSNDDIDKVLNTALPFDSNYKPLVSDNNEMDEWLDVGQWILLFLLPIALLSFRRGILLQMTMLSIILFSTSYSQESVALEWQDLWKTKNQQAKEKLENGEYQEAADTFSNEHWKAISEYKAGNFSSAAESFSKLGSADGFYNQGQALTKIGDYEGAAKAYDKALLLMPDMKDAIHNKEVVKELAKQKENEESQQSNSDQQSSENDQNNDDSDSNEQHSENGQNKENNQDSSSNSNENSDEESSDNVTNQEKGQTSQDDTEQNNNESSTEESSPNELTEQALEELKQNQQKQEQQALERQAAESGEQTSENEIKNEAAQSAVVDEELTEQEQLEKEQLENWLGQLPEDASRLLRNKFNYELQKKRQAYRNGQWEPTKKQRW